MKIHLRITPFCIVLFLLLNASCAAISSKTPPARNHALSRQEAQQRPTRDQISKEQAIAIANSEAEKSHQPLESFKIGVCERARLWVIIYDGAGSEYYIDKKSGSIVSVWKLPSLKDRASSDESARGHEIGQVEAIEIAKTHFVDYLLSQGDAKEHVTEYAAVACQLADVWRVFFEYREEPGQTLATRPNDNPPNYVIDKWTGQIIFTTHEIAQAATPVRSEEPLPSQAASYKRVTTPTPKAASLHPIR